MGEEEGREGKWFLVFGQLWRIEKKCVENNSLWAHILQSAQFAEKSGGESEIKKWNSLFDFLESGKKWNM